MAAAPIVSVDPAKPAVVVDGGPTLTYGGLEAQSNRIAHLFRAAGLRRGDHVAFVLENRAEAFVIAWAAQRSGLYYTACSTRLGVDELTMLDRPWQTVVWNDPVNLMSYVTYVFQKLFGYTRDKATKLMLDVHHKGKAVVSSGDKDKVEADVARLHAAGLWATLAHDS